MHLRPAPALLRTRTPALALLVAASVALPVLSPSRPAPHPVAPSVDTVAVHGVDAAAHSSAPPLRAEAVPGSHRPDEVAVRALTPQTPTDDFDVVGLSWTGSAPTMGVHVRYRSGHRWSGWTEVPVGSDHGPDPGTAEARHARQGTDPLLVPTSDGVQVRVDAAGPVPKDLRVDLVDPGTSPADATAAATPPAGSAVAAEHRPRIHSRAEWGAQESMRRGHPRYGHVHVGFVHHTAGTNRYTPSQVPALIRGIYAYHVRTLGWDDIGYNFLVDKWGRIWEGRRGGAARAVIGAHTLGYNASSFAMSALGNYESSSPSGAMVAAYTRLFAWKLGLSHVNPTDSVRLVRSDGSHHRFRRIAGHREAYPTECPGNRLQSRIPAIRRGARARQDTMLWHPTLNRQAFRYRHTAAKVSATASRGVHYRLTVWNRCAGVVKRIRGVTHHSGRFSVRWHGRTGTGRLARPGGYRLTLTAHGGRGGSATAVPYRHTVHITRRTGDPGYVCP